jgi:hypothetical protein
MLVLNVLLNILVGWLGASIGGCGCFGLIGCQCIHSKISRRLISMGIIVFVFAPMVFAGEYAVLWFWSAIIGLIANTLIVAMLSGTD